MSLLEKTYVKDRGRETTTGMAGVRPKARNPELHPGVPQAWQGPSTWVILHCFVKCISRGTGLQALQPGLEPVILQDTSITGSDLTYRVMMAVAPKCPLLIEFTGSYICTTALLVLV